MSGGDAHAWRVTNMPRKSTTAVSEKSTGNVFADLGMPHPEEELVKACLTLQIYRSIKSRHLTPAQAGEILGLKQPQVSLLMRNRSGNFSVERLMNFLTALGHDVEVRVTPTRKEHGRVTTVPSVSSIREQTGLSQPKFAQLLGVSVRTLQEWEQGRRAPSGAARTLLLIAARNPRALVDVA